MTGKLNDWIYPTKSGVRINKALVAEHISQDQNGNLIYVNQNFWSYAGGIWKTIDGGNTWGRLSSTNEFLWVNDIVVRDEKGIGVIYAAIGDS